LGIYISPTLKISLFFSNLEAIILGDVKSKNELALKLCNVVPLSSFIMDFNPYLCVSELNPF
jgi:hypothetical protein